MNGTNTSFNYSTQKMGQTHNQKGKGFYQNEAE